MNIHQTILNIQNNNLVFNENYNLTKEEEQEHFMQKEAEKEIEFFLEIDEFIEETSEL